MGIDLFFLIRAILNVCTFLLIQCRCHTFPVIICSALWDQYWKKSSLLCNEPLLQLRSVFVNCSSHQCVSWQCKDLLYSGQWVLHWVALCSGSYIGGFAVSICLHFGNYYFSCKPDEVPSKIFCSNMYMKLMMSATVNDNGIGSSPTEGLSFYSFSSRVSCLTYQRLTFSGVNPVHWIYSISIKRRHLSINVSNTYCWLLSFHFKCKTYSNVRRCSKVFGEWMT